MPSRVRAVYVLSGVATHERFANEPRAQLLQSGEVDPAGILRQYVPDQDLDDFCVAEYPLQDGGRVPGGGGRR